MILFETGHPLRGQSEQSFLVIIMSRHTYNAILSVWRTEVQEM